MCVGETSEGFDGIMQEEGFAGDSGRSWPRWFVFARMLWSFLSRGMHSVEDVSTHHNGPDYTATLSRVKNLVSRSESFSDVRPNLRIAHF